MTAANPPPSPARPPRRPAGQSAATPLPRRPQPAHRTKRPARPPASLTDPPATAAVVLQDPRDRTLLVRHTPQAGGDGTWRLPGGTARTGEPPAEAARCLIREQLRITTRIGSLLLVQWLAPGVTAYVFLGAELTRRTAADLTPDPAAVAELCMAEHGRAPGASAEADRGQERQRRAWLGVVHSDAPLVEPRRS